MNRWIVPLGLAIVATCAVILSFSALYDLARLCGFGPRIAALVPVLTDAGAAVATAVWLARTVATSVRRYARRLALALLGASVVGNAVAHALVAYELRPHWVVVVLVGALAPAVLAAIVHLVVLVRTAGVVASDDQEERRQGAGDVTRVEAFAEALAAPVERVAAVEPGVAVTDGDRQPDRQAPTFIVHDEVPALGIEWALPPAADGEVALTGGGARGGQDDRQGEDGDQQDATEDALAKARELAAAGAGRPRLIALGLTDHQAKQIIRDHRQPDDATAPRNGHRKAAP